MIPWYGAGESGWQKIRSSAYALATREAQAVIIWHFQLLYWEMGSRPWRPELPPTKEGAGLLKQTVDIHELPSESLLSMVVSFLHCRKKDLASVVTKAAPGSIILRHWHSPLSSAGWAIPAHSVLVTGGREWGRGELAWDGASKGVKATLPSSRPLWGWALVELCLQHIYTDAENRSSVRPALWVIRRTKSFFKTLPCLNTGCRGDRFCRHVMGEKNPLPWVILKPLEIFGKCEQLVPRIFSLINCFFKKRLCEGRELCISSPLPLAPFPAHWFFNTKR